MDQIGHDLVCQTRRRLHPSQLTSACRELGPPVWGMQQVAGEPTPTSDAELFELPRSWHDLDFKTGLGESAYFKDDLVQVGSLRKKFSSLDGSDDPNTFFLQTQEGTPGINLQTCAASSESKSSFSLASSFAHFGHATNGSSGPCYIPQNQVSVTDISFGAATKTRSSFLQSQSRLRFDPLSSHHMGLRFSN